jgi:hypothetical protein
MLQVHREKEGSEPWASNSGKIGAFTVFSVRLVAVLDVLPGASRALLIVPVCSLFYGIG